MANASITTTYVGQRSLPYVAPAILAANSIANNLITVRQNVRFKANLTKVSGVAIQDASCTFATPAAGQLTMADVVLTTEQFKVNEQICNNELREAWESENMRGSKSAAPAELQRFVAQWVAARTAETVEKNIWSGDYNHATGATTGTGVPVVFGGIMAKIVAGTPTYETTVAGAFTADDNATTGVLTHLNALVTTGGPDAVKGDYENTKIYMSRGCYNLYFNALSATYNLPFLSENNPKTYLGYEIVVPTGMPDDSLILSRVDNLYFGTDLLTDQTQAIFLNMLEQTGEDSTRAILQFAAGTQVVDLDSLGVVRRTS